MQACEIAPLTQTCKAHFLYFRDDGVSTGVFLVAQLTWRESVVLEKPIYLSTRVTYRI